MPTLALIKTKTSAEVRQSFVYNSRTYYGAVSIVGAVAAPYYSQPGDLIQIDDDTAAFQAGTGTPALTGSFVAPVDYNPATVYAIGQLVRYQDTIWTWGSGTAHVAGTAPGTHASWVPVNYRPDLATGSSIGSSGTSSSSGQFSDVKAATIRVASLKIEDTSNPGNYHTITNIGGVLQTTETTTS